MLHPTGFSSSVHHHHHPPQEALQLATSWDWSFSLQLMELLFLVLSSLWDRLAVGGNPTSSSSWVDNVIAAVGCFLFFFFICAGCGDRVQSPYSSGQLTGRGCICFSVCGLEIGVGFFLSSFLAPWVWGFGISLQGFMFWCQC